MTFAFHKGRYGVKLAETPAEVKQCQRLRHLCFHKAPGVDDEEIDRHCTHIMVAGPDGLVATCRVLYIEQDFHISYAAQRYDIEELSGFGPFLELGRFCVLPDVLDGDILRLIWGGLAKIVDDRGIKMLFGCASFPGADPQDHAAALGLLSRRFQAPAEFRVGRRAEAVSLSDFEAAEGNALEQLPPLLRTYLTMGGWVSDHAVIDHDLDTIHVFCALEIDKIPPARARALRSIAS